MRLIDADALRRNMEFICMGIMAGTEHYNAPLTEIDNAPTVFSCNACKNMGNERECVDCHDYSNYVHYDERPQGEREFIEILAQTVPEDLCTYPEYKGKPYYSIHYKENGEEFVGFGTYNPEVLSRYLRDYFMRGGAE